MANQKLTTQEQLQLRSVISSANAFVQGRELVQSFNSLTFEDLAQAQIERLTGKGTGTRPNVVTKIKKIEAELNAFVKQAKSLSVEAFPEPNASTDVNTPVLHRVHLGRRRAINRAWRLPR